INSFSMHGLLDGTSSLFLPEHADWQCLQHRLDVVEVFHVLELGGKRFSATDPDRMCSFYICLNAGISCICFSHVYSGYEVSNRTSSQKKVHSEIEVAWQMQRRAVTLENTVLHGQSIGPAPTGDRVAPHRYPTIILLHSLLTLGVFMTSFMPERPTAKASPALMICGTKDRVINFSHGLLSTGLNTQYTEQLKQFGIVCVVNVFCDPDTRSSERTTADTGSSQI
uniref:Abhydrolase domain containing 17C, depalmitoylase n=1 Tax=Scleropages formosus TaxID=113540 RepID=A0A8C9VV97_SCLFO